MFRLILKIMIITYPQKLSLAQENLIEQISSACGICSDTARLLAYRNIDTVQKAKAFLSPSKKQFISPYLLSGMQTAVDTISLAKTNNQNVLVFGDYDADGICATAILYRALTTYGVNVRCTVPEREEGYGVNVEKILRLNSENKIDLVITVDCGVSDKEAIACLQEKGIKVIVTDHHEIPETLPSCAVINPKLPNQEYGFSGLCGAGVAFKLATALIGEKAFEYLDFVALATVADSMELIEENRALVVEGLKLINKEMKPCFKYLINDISKQVNSGVLAYNVAPKINAGGRMGDANSALKLFISNDENEIIDLSVKLYEYNISRQEICEQVFQEAKAEVVKNQLYKKTAIIVKGDSWNLGVIGIVAAKLVEEYNLPVIIFGKKDGFYKGSARSVDGLNIYEHILRAKNLLMAFGGHSQAAGISVSEENFSVFEQTIYSSLTTETTPKNVQKEIFVDMLVTSAISVEFAKEIELLQPFGLSNKKPLFAVNGKEFSPKRLKANSPHFSFETEYISMLDFNAENRVKELELDIDKTLVFELNFSVFKGRESVKGFVKNCVLNSKDSLQLEKYAVVSELQKISQNKLTDSSATYISSKEVEVSSGFGVCYVITNPHNITNYKTDNLEIFIGRKTGEGYANCLIISPSELPIGYDKIVYLDCPLSYLPTQTKIEVVSNLFGHTLFEGVSCSRDDFIEIYKFLLNFSGKQFKSLQAFCRENSNKFNYKTLAFAMQTFIELGIVIVKQGFILIDRSKFKPLTNSITYTTILERYGR